MSARCEPPPELRDVDGWHWVETQAGQIRFCRRWWKARGEWCWANMDDRTLRGFRYLAPAAPPDVVRALVEALEGVVMVWDKFYPSLLIFDEVEDIEFGTMNAARAALARAKDAGL